MSKVRMVRPVPFPVTHRKADWVIDLRPVRLSGDVLITSSGSVVYGEVDCPPSEFAVDGVGKISCTR